MSYVVNPFQNLELRIPEEMREDVDLFCQTQPSGGTKPSPDDSPFERQLDIWFLAVCLGANAKKRTKLTKHHRFITGEILSRDPYRIELLELLAIAYSNDPWILQRPSEMIEMANEFAASGFQRLFNLLKEGNAKPIWNLTDGLIDLIQESET